MLNNNIVCTYGPEYYKNKLSSIKENDTILLYYSGVGIIGMGKAVKNAKDNIVTNPPNNFKTIEKNINTNEYTLDVDWIIKNTSTSPNNPEPSKAKAVTPPEIKKMGHRMFVPTVQYLKADIGEKIVEQLKMKATKE
jgi:hypothetical protein